MNRAEYNDANRQSALDVVVSGRVQGVGYRFFCLRKANEYGICGWARNCPDGTVQVLAVGRDEAVKEFVAELGRGPTFGKVENIAVNDVSETNTAVFSEFLIR